MKRTRTPEKKKEKPIKENKTFVPNKNKLLLIALFSTFFSIILSFLFTIPNEEILLTSNLKRSSIYIIIVSVSIILFWGTYKSKIQFLSYLLLLLLIVSISIGLIPESVVYQSNNNTFFKLKIIQSILSVPTIFIGLVTVWFKKDKLIEHINRLFKEENSKISFNFYFKRNEIVYTSFFILIIGISVYTNFNRLDRFDLYSDEAQVTQGAAGYLYSGKYHQYDFANKKLDTTKNYNRAKPHQYILAKTYKYFGISTWTSRFPSALFGVLLIIIAYFISRFFIKDKIAALLIIFAFTFFYEFLLLQRWARMYAMLIPIFLLAFYFGYRFMTDKNKLSFLKLDTHPLINNYLNYNYLQLPFFLVFAFLAYRLHMNSVILFLIFFLFSLLAIPLTKEKRYSFIFILGSIIILSQLIFPFNLGYRWLTFFEVNNFEYYKYALLGQPFSFETNIIFISIIAGAIIISKNKDFIKNYLVLFSVTITGLILFSYSIDFAISFRYMSFLASLTIMLVTASSLLVIKALYNKYIYSGIVVLILASVLLSFNTRYKDLYQENFVSPAQPSKAWKVITENYKNDQLLLMHWGPSIYLKDLDSNAHIKSLYKFRNVDFNTVLDSIKNYKSGWVTWHTHNAVHIHKDLIEYANSYFIKHHGYGIDNTGVEVFSYTDSMHRPMDLFNIERFFPFVNLNLQKSYSVAFNLKLNEQTLGEPFFVKDGDKDVISFKVNNNQSIIINYHDPQSDSIVVQLKKETNHIAWYHEIEENKTNFGIFLNGKLISNKQLSGTINKIIKLKINPIFNGVTDDLRIYDFIIGEEHLKEIIKNSEVIGSDELKLGEETFKTLFHWQKR